MQARLPVDDPKFIAHLRAKVNKACFTKFKGANPDDMFQEVYIKFWKNPDSKQSVDQAIIDVLRVSGSGRAGGVHQKSYEKKRAFMQAESLDDPDTKRQIPGFNWQHVEHKLDAATALGETARAAAARYGGAILPAGPPVGRNSKRTQCN